MVVCLDNNEPTNFTETSLRSMTGDFHSKWADKSGAYVFFKNGKVGCISEVSVMDDGLVTVRLDEYIFFYYFSSIAVTMPPCLCNTALLCSLVFLKIPNQIGMKKWSNIVPIQKSCTLTWMIS
jgi:hypothetical protein